MHAKIFGAGLIIGSGGMLLTCLVAWHLWRREYQEDRMNRIPRTLADRCDQVSNIVIVYRSTSAR